MSPEFMIEVKDIGKCYQIYDKPEDRLKQFIIPALRRLARRPQKLHYREFWALKDVSFRVRKGETVGIIGCNGSGKSTLLQLVCGTLFPTDGSIQTRGRIAALLELGSGFNPDFSGRENVYLNASLLGLTESETHACYEEIVAFSGIGDFIDQPISTYSSGMVVRLAFAVQVQIQPDILVVDEALAVGDEAFQRKCYQRLDELKARGVAVLFVTHDAGTVVQICDRVILLDGGRKLLEGPPKPLVSLYQKLLFASPEAREGIIEDIRSGTALSAKSPTVKPEPGFDGKPAYDPELVSPDTLDYSERGAAISEVHLVDQQGERVNLLNQGQHYRLRYRADFFGAAGQVGFGMMIKTVSGMELGGASTDPLGQGDCQVRPNDRFQAEIEFTCSLNPGIYFMNAGIMGMVGDERTYLARKIDALIFRVNPTTPVRFTGLVNFAVIPGARRLSS